MPESGKITLETLKSRLGRIEFDLTSIPACRKTLRAKRLYGLEVLTLRHVNI
jgi:hypothetical protein